MTDQISEGRIWTSGLVRPKGSETYSDTTAVIQKDLSLAQLRPENLEKKAIDSVVIPRQVLYQLEEVTEVLGENEGNSLFGETSDKPIIIKLPTDEKKVETVRESLRLMLDAAEEYKLLISLSNELVRIRDGHDADTILRDLVSRRSASKSLIDQFHGKQDLQGNFYNSFFNSYIEEMPIHTLHAAQEPDPEKDELYNKINNNTEKMRDFIKPEDEKYNEASLPPLDREDHKTLVQLAKERAALKIQFAAKQLQGFIKI